MSSILDVAAQPSPVPAAPFGADFTHLKVQKPQDGVGPEALEQQRGPCGGWWALTLAAPTDTDIPQRLLHFPLKMGHPHTTCFSSKTCGSWARLGSQAIH